MSYNRTCFVVIFLTFNFFFNLLLSKIKATNSNVTAQFKIDHWLSEGRGRESSSELEASQRYKKKPCIKKRGERARKEAERSVVLNKSCDFLRLGPLFFNSINLVVIMQSNKFHLGTLINVITAWAHPFLPSFLTLKRCMARQEVERGRRRVNLGRVRG